jgi:hypothetical protein
MTLYCNIYNVTTKKLFLFLKLHLAIINNILLFHLLFFTANFIVSKYQNITMVTCMAFFHFALLEVTKAFKSEIWFSLSHGSRPRAMTKRLSIPALSH